MLKFVKISIIAVKAHTNMLKNKNGTLLQGAIVLNISLPTNLWKNIMYMVSGNGTDTNKILPKCGFLCRVCFISEEKKHHISTCHQQYVSEVYVWVCVESEVTK